MQQPNIVMITCHDLGRHLGCYGVPSVQTPNIDRLAEKGVRFTNFYSTSAVCSPARGSLHTGRYPQSNGLLGLTHAPWWWQLNADERHTAQILRDNGYSTNLVGFNHIHHDPARLGYDKALSPECKAPETVEAAQQIIQNAETETRPFFMKVGFTEVHRGFKNGTDTSKGVFVPPWLQDTPDIRSDLAEYQATIAYFDTMVGKILDALAASPIAEKTLVVLASDHGMPYPGAKWTVRKAGIEVPLIMYQPGTVFSGGRTIDALMSNVDVLPTLLDYIGAEGPSEIQGISFMDTITGTATKAPRKAAFAQYTPEMKRDNTSRSIITDQYHLIRYFDAGRAVAYPVDVHPQRFASHELRCRTRMGSHRPFVQLFDIQADPYELEDIGDRPENAAIVADLSRQLLDWMRQVNDPLLAGPVPTPYYQRSLQDLQDAAEAEGA